MARRLDPVWALAILGAGGAAALAAPFTDPLRWSGFVVCLVLVGAAPVVAWHRRGRAGNARAATTQYGGKDAFASALEEDGDARSVVVVGIERFPEDLEPEEVVVRRVVGQLSQLEGLCYRLDSARVAVLTPLPERVLAPRLEALRHLLNQGLPEAMVAVGYATKTSGESLASVAARATTALAQARADGGVHVRLFDRHTSPVPLTRERVGALRDLVNGGHLSIVYQPVFAVADQRVIGYEALMRPAARSGLSADDAFSLAEQTGLVAELDQRCLAAIALDAPGFDLTNEECLFVNITPAAFTHERFVLVDLIAAARRAGLAPQQLVLELSERGSYEPAALTERLDAARASGVRVALDRVGAGASGLNVLLANTFDFVKIDRRVVQAATRGDRRGQATLEGICTLAKQADSQVIVEGIETVDDWIYMRTLHARSNGTSGVIGAQGYHLGKPAPGINHARRGAIECDEVPESAAAPDHGQPDATATAVAGGSRA